MIAERFQARKHYNLNSHKVEQMSNNPVEQHGFVVHTVNPTKKTVAAFEKEWAEQRDWREAETCAVNAKAAELEANGHTCVCILETDPPQLEWCEQETCAGD